jgi:predicted sulfurtransferase
MRLSPWASIHNRYRPTMLASTSLRPKSIISLPINQRTIGTFQGALTPPLKHFRELPDYIDQNVEQFKDKEVLMFCTAGVRCERASAYLKSKGVAQQVYQLEGGIHRYVEEYPDGFFRGKNYVFDGRLALQVTEDVIGSCALCAIACDDYNNCLNAECNKHFICCDTCIVAYNYTCSTQCFNLVAEQKVHLRPIYRAINKESRCS